MKKGSACHCLLCKLEARLREQFEEPEQQQEYSKVAGFSPLLSAFPSISALTAHLRACRSPEGDGRSADTILGELLHTFRTDSAQRLVRDVFLLLFIPSLHSTSRQVARRYPSLPIDDTTQHLVACLLEVLGSSELRNRSSHLAFAISRMLKRSVFDWAQRETRLHASADGERSSSESDDAEPFERTVLLRHFLFRCHREGLLSGPDLELLIRTKLEQECGTTLYSNALRQKVKRLLHKLRRAAQAPHSHQSMRDRRASLEFSTLLHSRADKKFLSARHILPRT
jgi:hypothetical protein